jgi:hypothetical protein
MICRRVGWYALWTLAIAVVVAGCQPASEGDEEEPTVSIQGTVSNGGPPLTVENPKIGYRFVEIRFYPLDADGQLIQQGQKNWIVEAKDGSFTAEIPEGKYRVAVHQWEDVDKDMLQGKFSLENSTITRDVTAGANIEIDLSNP